MPACFAAKLQSCLRVGDILARLGGDEFVILLSGLRSKLELDTICVRIIDRVHTFVTWNEDSIEMSASIGVAYHEGESTIITSNILREADQAMYAAKQAGKNCYQIVKIN